jgi:crotonobetainyl-CoA:carnitine CoA-transferase CaiB-like acyl-CoA transferase
MAAAQQPCPPTMPGILDGLKVLDLTRIVAGPWCTQLLADMGATVWKIEKPGEGDDTRRMTPFMLDAQGQPTAESAVYLAVNRGKQSLTIDIATPEGAALVRQLAARCDVLIENYKAGGLKKYGLDEPSIRAIKPDIVYCSLTGFGSDGPYAARPAYDFVMQGLSGLMSTIGHPGQAPVRTGVPITDVLTGLYTTIAVLGAVHHHHKTGEGQHLDMAMLDAAVATNGHLALSYLMGHPPPQPAGNSNPIAAPANVFACADGHLILSAGNNGQFAAMATVLGHPEWATDERFATNAQRVRNRPALDAAIGQATAPWAKADLVAACEAAGVPAGPIQQMDAVFADPQVQHRGLQMSLPHASGVDVPSLRSPLRFSATPVAYSAPPQLGQHTDAVLAAELGLDEAALAHLRQQRVL